MRTILHFSNETHLEISSFFAKFFPISVDTQVVEIGQGKKWEKQTLIRTTINSGYMYITQFENNPGNFVSLSSPISHLCKIDNLHQSINIIRLFPN